MARRRKERGADGLRAAASTPAESAALPTPRRGGAPGGSYEVGPRALETALWLPMVGMPRRRSGRLSTPESCLKDTAHRHCGARAGLACRSPDDDYGTRDEEYLRDLVGRASLMPEGTRAVHRPIRGSRAIGWIVSGAGPLILPGRCLSSTLRMGHLEDAPSRLSISRPTGFSSVRGSPASCRGEKESESWRRGFGVPRRRIEVRPDSLLHPSADWYRFRFRAPPRGFSPGRSQPGLHRSSCAYGRSLLRSCGAESIYSVKRSVSDLVDFAAVQGRSYPAELDPVTVQS